MTDNLKRLEALAARVDAAPGQQWLRQLAQHAIHIAMCQERVALAETRHRTMEEVEGLTEAVLLARQSCLAFAEYHESLDAIIKKAVGG